MERKMKKKVISMLLVTSMLMGSLIGCGNKEADDANSGETVKLTVGIPQNVSITDYDDNSLTKYIEESLNMDLKFQYFSSNSGEYSKQLALMCSSNETLPDVLWGFTSLGRGNMNQYGEDGYFWI